MAKVSFIKDTGISTFQTKKHNGFIHVGVNHPREMDRELNSTIKQLMG